MPYPILNSFEPKSQNGELAGERPPEQRHGISRPYFEVRVVLDGLQVVYGLHKTYPSGCLVSYSIFKQYLKVL